MYTNLSSNDACATSNADIKYGWDFHFADHVILRILMARGFDIK